MGYRIFLFFRNLFLSCITIIRVIINSKWFIRFSKKTDGDTVLILGNGPSLSVNLSRDMSILEKNPVLCVNGFALSEAYELLKPVYYVLADDAFWADELPERTQNFVDSTLDTIINKTRWSMTLFLPIKGVRVLRKRKSELFTHPFIIVQEYNSSVLRGFKCIVHVLLQSNMGLLSRQNVLVPSLLLAVNMGYKRIILLGADHSWHRNLFVANDNRLYLKDEHFYKDENNLVPVMLGNRPSRIYEQFDSMAKTLRLYWEVADYMQRKKSVIINASETSFIDAFPRATLNELF